MKLTVLYTKSTWRGMELLVGHVFKHDFLPTITELMSDYEIVYQDDEWGGNRNPDNVFGLFNSDMNPLSCDKEQKKLKALGVGHTSLSVGDMVIIDDQVYLCRPQGWLQTPVKIEWYGKT